MTTKLKDAIQATTPRQRELWKNVEFSQRMYAMYNQRQNAFKFTANSTYGFFGAQQGYFPNIEIASSGF